MDELYKFHSSISCPVDSNFIGDGSSSNSIAGHHYNHQELVLPATEVVESNQVATGLEMSDIIKAQIANHPLYPNLLSAYIHCRKVGAPAEIASLLEEISRENHPITTATEIGKDPELDHFMRSYCEVLHKYKEELSKPFDEATNFLSTIESQLSDLCKETLHSTDDGGEEDLNCGEVGRQEYSSHGDEELKDMLMRKYSGYLTSLKKDFLKKRKKGKLPKDALTALLHWWNTNYRWPYPTEEEKNRLSEMTGLDQKQINNWFINQRKRHWRPSEDMRFALMEGVSGDTNIA